MMGLDAEIWQWLKRSKQINPFPRQILRKRMVVQTFDEFMGIFRGYNGKTDLYTSLFSNWQLKNNIYDCLFIDIDCYTELGESVKTLNEYNSIVEEFLMKHDLHFRRLWSGSKGTHYYIVFPPTYFQFFSNAARKWFEKMPKVKRFDIQTYQETGELVEVKTWPFDPKAVSKPMQLVRVIRSKHPRTGLICKECYGPVGIPFLERKENWLPDVNAHVVDELKTFDREPDKIDRDKEIIDFELADSPKCIRNAIRKMRGHLGHDQAWHLANYLITLGLADAQVLSVFKADPRYDESVALQQIDSIRSSSYGNMGCNKIAFHGLCDEQQRLACPMYPSIDRYLFGESEPQNEEL